MAFSITVDSKLRMDEVIDALHGEKLGKFAATEWYRLYRRYVPEDSGAMYNTVSIEPWVITHTSPYAHYQYEGRTMGPSVPINGGESFFTPVSEKWYTGGSLHYKKAGACAHWDQAAIPTEGPKLARAIQAFMQRGDW